MTDETPFERHLSQMLMRQMATAEETPSERQYSQMLLKQQQIQDEQRSHAERRINEYRNQNAYADWKSTFNEYDDPSLMQQPRYQEINVDTFGFDAETKAAFNKWMDRRFSRLEKENKYYQNEVVALRRQRDELLDKITGLMNEVNHLKATGYFPEKYNGVVRTSRYSTLDV